ncbi:hypothetical protein pEaSNUABM14_00044 [Erwinia phage pEa_SNUABM_14]|nr:hypothetical protein pEaSNUABM45_00044 [Erwinia phage pEa_SNUABM_45]QYW04028.1 hypothetical protein pEaSNUABM46_00044 [Erwinia phage pEa_SNUABM_46]QYW04369.1 hypothetical protein pEaSNUABM14_00044 [Erwinia phage pEa_SNUABM_14]
MSNNQKLPPNVFKYVMFLWIKDERTNKDRTHIPIIFPRHIMHSDMGDEMRGYAINNGFVENRYHQTMEPVSAGFVDLNTLSCFGESESMELKSRSEEDSLILREYFKDDGKLPEVPVE